MRIVDHPRLKGRKVVQVALLDSREEIEERIARPDVQFEFGGRPHVHLSYIGWTSVRTMAVEDFRGHIFTSM